MAWRHSRTLRPLSTMMSIAGVFSGLWGLLFTTWLGMVIGMLIKIALTFLMIGIFVFALVTP